MFFFRHKIFKIFVLFSLSFNLYGFFKDADCIQENFVAKVSHKGKPFGLTDVIVDIDKKNCVITLNYQKYKFWKKHWVIDVCRGPIHIKKGNGAIEVFKKDGPCLKGNKTSSFCDSFKEIENILQDDGLIFAEGEKDILSDPHGKVYCAYLLIHNYLQDEVVFNRHDSFENVLRRNEGNLFQQKDPNTACSVPEGQEKAQKDGGVVEENKPDAGERPEDQALPQASKKDF